MVTLIDSFNGLDGNGIMVLNNQGIEISSVGTI